MLVAESKIKHLRKTHGCDDTGVWWAGYYKYEAHVENNILIIGLKYKENRKEVYRWSYKIELGEPTPHALRRTFQVAVDTIRGYGRSSGMPLEIINEAAVLELFSTPLCPHCKKELRL